LDPYKRELKEKEKENMKKTIDLLNKAVSIGFSREKALRDIDASLDEELGTENRKPLMEEEISDQLYEDILFGFRCEAEEP
jgi:Flp pilus assembly protein TadB